MYCENKAWQPENNPCHIPVQDQCRSGRTIKLQWSKHNLDWTFNPYWQVTASGLIKLILSSLVSAFKCFVNITARTGRFFRLVPFLYYSSTFKAYKFNYPLSQRTSIWLWVVEALRAARPGPPLSWHRQPRVRAVLQWHRAGLTTRIGGRHRPGHHNDSDQSAT